MVGKDKGKQGNVVAYIRELNAVFVYGLNTVNTYLQDVRKFIYQKEN